MDAGAFYDIANIDPHSEFDALACRNLRIALKHRALDLDRAAQGFHRTDEQDQEAIAGGPDHPPMVFSNLGFNELGMVGVELSKCAFVIGTDEAAVSGDIGYQDSHKPAFDFLTGHG
jgi:hypothetical protein